MPSSESQVGSADAVTTGTARSAPYHARRQGGVHGRALRMNPKVSNDVAAETVLATTGSSRPLPGIPPRNGARRPRRRPRPPRRRGNPWPRHRRTPPGPEIDWLRAEVSSSFRSTNYAHHAGLAGSPRPRRSGVDRGNKFDALRQDLWPKFYVPQLRYLGENLKSTSSRRGAGMGVLGRPCPTRRHHRVDLVRRRLLLALVPSAAPPSSPRTFCGAGSTSPRRCSRSSVSMSSLTTWSPGTTR